MPDSNALPVHAERWAALGPYYAMFPLEFVKNIVKTYTTYQDSVLDPFAGRGSSIFIASALGRVGAGVEISPVGWVYSKVKIAPASPSKVTERMREVIALSGHYKDVAQGLPVFFKYCYSKDVLNFLIAARENLDWKANKTDRSLMAILLVYLHGKYNQSLSNQMRQTKAMSPEYSIQWWKEQTLSPPNIDIKDFLNKRIKWRYELGYKNYTDAYIAFGDARKKLCSLPGEGYKLLLTSPPYFGVTNYHYDQWLRLWLLGAPSIPVTKKGNLSNRFGNEDEYIDLLEAVFETSAELMRKDSVIYVRTDAREFTLDVTLDALRDAFPKKKMRIEMHPLKKLSQTGLFGDKSPKPGEVDVILR